ncbi:hypothetical protein INR49_005387 [Caranx melampygus]|nr:hypothetical protein INR49_005387 [Caranx melampygus]
MAMESFRHFLVALSAAGVVGLVSVIFVLRWVLHFREGLAWDGGPAEFNWHPLLMVAGFIFLQGVAIIVYRLPWTWQWSKLTMKFIHAGLNLVAFIFAVVSLVAVFDFHNAAKIPNMYSLHSWLGLTAVILYCLQLVLGVGIYLIPVTPVSWRAAFMPLHVYSGLLLFASVTAVALMGITEKLIFGLSNPKYKDSPPEAVFVNVLGVLLVIFAALILWIATRSSWKRPSDQTMHALHSNVGGEDNSKVGPALSQLSDGADAEASGDIYSCKCICGIMSDKSELKAELERKKQRLAQIREEKKRKEEERKKKEAEQLKDTTHHQDDSDLEKKRRDAEALLQSMGITPEVPARNAKAGNGQSHTSGLPPRETVTYTKETQTPAMTQQKEEEEEEEEIAPPQLVAETPTEKQDQKEEEEAPPHELTEEEKLQILHSEEFVNFFDHSTRIIERALSEHVDLFFDYSGRDLEEKEGEIQAGAKLSLNRQFMDERWSKHRVVTCLDWSPQYPELLVASYNNNEDAPHEPDGVALVWNMKYKKATPEYSAVMSAAFAKFHPNVVVGGTYSGQIVLWDNRSNKRTPVQRTPLSAAAHTHPVYCVNVVGTQNAHNLISISTDGKMCSWSLDMLSQPQDSMELVFKQSKAVAVTSMSFPLGDVNNFVVGSEDGSVYMSCRHGSKAGISEMFEGHHGPITGIHCHTAAGPLDFSHLFVTSSFDWTVKLWSTKNNKPLYSFEDNSDYVYDVMWSPTHPTLFACVDGVGHLDLWNLNNDTEVPTASITVEGNPALNRVRWAHSGKEIAVGDSDGRVLVYEVGEQIAVPRNDEWTRFVRTLAEINENRDDAEELAAQRLSA